MIEVNSKTNNSWKADWPCTNLEHNWLGSMALVDLQSYNYSCFVHFWCNPSKT